MKIYVTIKVVQTAQILSARNATCGICLDKIPKDSLRDVHVKLTLVLVYL